MKCFTAVTRRLKVHFSDNFQVKGHPIVKYALLINTILKEIRLKH